MRLNVNCKRWQKLLLISFYSVFVYNYHVRVFEKFAGERASEQHKNINRIVYVLWPKATAATATTIKFIHMLKDRRWGMGTERERETAHYQTSEQENAG